MGLERSAENGEQGAGFRSRLRSRGSIVDGWGGKVEKEVLKKEKCWGVCWDSNGESEAEAPWESSC